MSGITKKTSDVEEDRFKMRRLYVSNEGLLRIVLHTQEWNLLAMFEIGHKPLLYVSANGMWLHL